MSKRLKKAQASIKRYTSNTYSFLYVNPISFQFPKEGKRGREGEDKEEDGRRKGGTQ